MGPLPARNGRRSRQARFGVRRERPSHFLNQLLAERHPRPADEDLPWAAQSRDVGGEIAAHDEDVGGVPLQQPAGLAGQPTRVGSQ